MIFFILSNLVNIILSPRTSLHRSMCRIFRRYIRIDWHDSHSGTSLHRNLCRLSMNMDRLTDLIPIQRQTYTETMCRLCRKKDRLHQWYNMRPDRGWNWVEYEGWVSHYPCECATTALYYHYYYRGGGAEMIPIQKQAYTETCLYIEREKLTQAWYWTSLLCYSLLESMRKLLLPSCSTLLSVRPSIRSIGSSCSSTHISQGNLGSNWLLYQINSFNYYIFKSAMLFSGSDCLLSGP